MPLMDFFFSAHAPIWACSLGLLLFLPPHDSLKPDPTNPHTRFATQHCFPLHAGQESCLILLLLRLPLSGCPACFCLLDCLIAFFQFGDPSHRYRRVHTVGPPSPRPYQSSDPLPDLPAMPFAPVPRSLRLPIHSCALFPPSGEPHARQWLAESSVCRILP